MTFDEWYEDKARQGLEVKTLARLAYYKGRGDQAAEDQAKYAAYREGVRESNARNLPGVDKKQVMAYMNSLASELRDDYPYGLASALADWFNDPNRDAPVQPTMHPDVAKKGGQGIFFDVDLPPYMRDAGTLEQMIEERDAPAKPKCDVQWTTESLPNGNVRIKGTAVRRPDPNNLAELEAYADEQGRAALERSVAGCDLDLNNLPDYETWFEQYGPATLKPRYEILPTTVHELYTMFRARLLDELRQAGILGDDQ